MELRARRIPAACSIIYLACVHLALMGRLSEDASASYLSGLLIGHEVRAAMPREGRVHLVGAATLCALYAQAIEACGGGAKVEDEDAAALGLAAIGRRLQWT